MLTMLIAYDSAGNVVATLDYLVARDAEGAVVGLVDFAALEDEGGKLRDVWDVEDAVGSGTWPEWIGGRAHDFKVELAGKRISSLVHKESGHRRSRADIAAAIEAVEPDAQGRKDIRHIIGGPNRPLVLDEKGKTVGRSVSSGTPKNLPVAGRG